MRGGAAATGVLTAVAVIAGLTVATILFWTLALGAPSAGDVVRKQLPHIIAVSCATVLGYALICAVLRRTDLRLLAVGLFTTAVWLATVVDLTFLNYFGARFLQLRPFLPVGAGEIPPVTVIASYARQYASVLIAVCAAAPLLLLAVAYSRVRASHLVVAITAVACFAAMFTANRVAAGRAKSAGIPDVIAGQLERPDPALLRLKAVRRPDVVEPSRPVAWQPRTIVLVINESVGRDFPSSEGKQKPLFDKLAELSDAPDRWTVFSNPVTNSNATDVSIPSILTGSGTHEGYDKLHAMPFLFDLAKARGYQTALITSSVLDWGNFDKFFQGAPIDHLYSAEVSGQPIVNDLTIDDAFPFRRLADLIAGSDADIFAVMYSNALHVPYQQRSAFDIPATLRDRRARASAIVESGYRSLFRALRQSGRFDDALLIAVGDHGEYEFRGAAGTFAHIRLESYSDTILSPIFMLKPPARLPDDMRNALAANARGLVANLDIAPTIADLLGVRPKPPLAYAGYSVFRPVPEDRVSFAVSTNVWRGWPRTAIAVARGRQRLVCTSLELCELRQAGAASGTKDGALIMDHELMRAALAEPVMLQSLVKIYRDHFAGSR